MSNTPQKLPRQVALFGAVSFLNDFASEMVYPLIPAFITSVLGGGATAVALVDGVSEMTASLVKYVAGRLADRERLRGPLIVLGYLAAVVVRPLIGFAGAAWQVIGLRVADRIGKGARTPPRDALIADVTPPEMRGRAFGLQRGLDHAGAVVGPLVAWYLLRGHADRVRSVIQASAIPGVLVLILAIWAVRGGRTRATAEAPPRPAPVPTPSGATAAPAPVPRAHRTALLVITLFYLVRVPETLMILRSQELGVPLGSVLLLWAALHVVRSSSSFLGGARSDQGGSASTMWLGWACYVFIAFGFALAEGPSQAWALFLALGVVAGLTESPERTLVARLAGRKQGSGFGVYHALTGVAALVGAVVLGEMYQRFGPASAFLASAAGGGVLVLAWSAVALADRGAEGA